jgi:hypothetical protein
MSLRIIFGIIFLVAGAICGLLTSLKTLEMVDRVNQKLPQKEQFELLGWYLPKQVNLWRAYKTFYPKGTLLSQDHFLTVFCVVSMVVCACCSLFFAR